MDMELCYVDIFVGPSSYREGGYSPKPPVTIWWRVSSKTHTVEDRFMFLFFDLVERSHFDCLQLFYTVQGMFLTFTQDMRTDISLDAKYKISHI